MLGRAIQLMTCLDEVMNEGVPIAIGWGAVGMLYLACKWVGYPYAGGR